MKIYNNIKNFLGDESGVAFIEAALYMVIIFIPTFIGLVELSMYIRTKEKMTRTAHDMGEIISSISKWRNDEEVTKFMPASAAVAQPAGVRFSVAVCDSALSAPIYEDTYTTTGVNFISDDAKCGLGHAVGGPSQANPSWDDVTCDLANLPTESATGAVVSTVQYVVTGAECNYAPMLKIFDWVIDNKITSTSISPMRDVMIW